MRCVARQRAAGILPAEGGHHKFVSRSEWARSNCRQDAGSTLPEDHGVQMHRRKGILQKYPWPDQVRWLRSGLND